MSEQWCDRCGTRIKTAKAVERGRCTNDVTCRARMWGRLPKFVSVGGSHGAEFVYRLQMERDEREVAA